MSSFSSVVQKPGKKIVPKAAPRRIVQRRPVAPPSTVSVETQHETQNNDQTTARVTNIHEPNNQEAQQAQVEQEQDDIVQKIQPPTVAEDSSLIFIRRSTSNAPLEESADVSTSGVIPEPEPRSSVPAEDVPPLDTPGSLIPVEAGETHTLEDTVAPVHASVTAEFRSNEETSPSAIPEPSIGNNSVAQSRPRRKAAEISANIPSPRKRRRITPQTVPEPAPPQDIEVTPAAQSSLQSHTIPRRYSSQSQQSDDLFESATRRAASVSRLANDIDLQTRSLQNRSERNGTDRIETDPETEGVSASTLAPSRRGRRKRKKTLQEQAAEVVANSVGRSRTSVGQRASTPENAGEYELEPNEVKMGELCEDRRVGKKSALETEMQENWADIVQRRKEDRERALANAESRRRKTAGQKQQLNLSNEPVVALAPAMTVVNGVIVVDQASREIDRGAQLQQAAFQDLDNVREDKDYYKYVNQGTVGIKPGRGHHTKWDEESNERFFQGLRMFGTDFLMIANMFPGFTRKQIKAKFNREENANKARVQECLRDRQPVQLEDYASMANKEVEEFQTLESIQKELDEQEKRLREEDNERRKREGFATSTNDNTQPPGAETNQDGTERQSVSTQPNRFDAIAAEIVEAAAGPGKRRRKPTTTNNKKVAKIGRQLQGGVEEILGNIHEVAV